MSLKYEVVYNVGSRIAYTSYGKYHRDNGPSIIWSFGDMHWFKYGVNTYFHYPGKKIVPMKIA